MMLVRHVGTFALRDQLLAQGWRILGRYYPPISPVIECAVWMVAP